MQRSVVLSWDGKVEAAERLRSAVPPLVIDEELAPPSGGEADFRLIAGDALDVARALDRGGLRGQVDLIYLDPPYGSGVNYRHEQRMNGASGAIASVPAYRDSWAEGQAAYLDMLYPRLLSMRPLLQPTGSLWIQVDWRASYLVRMLCDEVFGRERFLNEIVWRRSPNLGRQARSGQFGRTLDSIIVYGNSAQARLAPPSKLTRVAKGAAREDADSGRFYTLAPRGDYTDASLRRLATEGRVHRTAKGNVAIRYWLERDESGELCRRQPVDALWADIPPLRHASPEERTGYPTQKPEALLARIIAAGSPEHGLVVDLFAGSGTTGVTAARLGRRFVLGDDSPVAIATARGRLLRGGIRELAIERCGAAPERAFVPITVEDRGDGSVELRLSPTVDDEPVAWAISCGPAGTSGKRASRPFHIDWHAERGTGRSPAPLPLSAIVPRAPVLTVRVYLMSGKRAEMRCRLATDGRARPTMSIEDAP